MEKSLIGWIKEWEKGFRGKVKNSMTSHVVIFNDYGIVFEGREAPGINFCCNYEKVPDPVDFITAAKAYTEGKAIICEFPCWPDKMHIVRARIFKDHDHGTQSGDALSMYMIETGTWYIED